MPVASGAAMRRVRQVGGDQPLELGDEPMHALGRQIQTEQLDRDQPVVLGIVRAKHGSQCAGANLMKNTEGTEGVRRRSASSVRVQ